MIKLNNMKHKKQSYYRIAFYLYNETVDIMCLVCYYIYNITYKKVSIKVESLSKLENTAYKTFNQLSSTLEHFELEEIHDKNELP